MNIKELEEKSGMPRANIRYYETKGLLSPARQENGYRNYTPEDLTTLQRIQLLRALDFSLEDIRALQTGEKLLQNELDDKLRSWSEKRTQANQAERICAAMQSDGADYASLDVEKYWHAAAPAAPTAAAPAERPAPPPGDRLPYPFAPLRRFVARALDNVLYGLLYTAVLALVFHVNVSVRSTLYFWGNIVFLLLMTLLLEPVFLHCFGATPGKWLMGLRMESDLGGRLTLADAQRRTLSALWWGEGFFLPVFSLVRLWKSFRGCMDGEESPWDVQCDVAYTLRDTYRRRWGYAAIALALFECVSYLTVCLAGLPPHRGAITLAEFTQNYNQQLRYYEGEVDDWLLTEDAQWIRVQEETGFSIDFSEPFLPEWHYETDADGTLVRLGFTCQNEHTSYASGLKTRSQLAALAFCGANAPLFPAAQNVVAHAMSDDFLTAADFCLGGVHVTYSFEGDGFAPIGRDALMLTEEGGAFSVHFEMTRVAPDGSTAALDV